LVAPNLPIPLKAKNEAGKLAISRGGRTPVYEQIAAHLLQQIGSGSLAPGSKLPGIKAMAKTYGVNHLTLRRALQALQEKSVVSLQSGRGTFVVDQFRRGLRVALILPNLNESSSRISAGVHELLGPTSSAVSIFHYDENPELEIEQLSRLETEACDGAIVFPSLNPATLKPLLRMIIAGYPLVFLDRAPSELPCWSVSSDNFRGGYLAATRLIDAGCRRLACVATEIGTVHDRLEGYKRGMNDRGRPVDYSLIHSERSERYRVESIIDEWMAREQPPDGIFFPNDFRATVGIRRLTQLGRRVPDEIKVVGFDNLSIAELTMPSLTTIAQDFSAIGRLAAKILCEMVALPTEQRFKTRRELVPVELIARESA